MRFSRIQLTDVLHRRRAAFPRQGRNGLGAMTVPHKVISPRLSGDPQVTSLMLQRGLRLWRRLATNPASRSSGQWLIASKVRAEFPYRKHPPQPRTNLFRSSAINSGHSSSRFRPVICRIRSRACWTASR